MYIYIVSLAESSYFIFNTNETTEKIVCTSSAPERDKKSERTRMHCAQNFWSPKNKTEKEKKQKTLLRTINEKNNNNNAKQRRQQQPKKKKKTIRRKIIFNSIHGFNNNTESGEGPKKSNQN